MQGLFGEILKILSLSAAEVLSSENSSGSGSVRQKTAQFSAAPSKARWCQEAVNPAGHPPQNKSRFLPGRNATADWKSRLPTGPQFAEEPRSRSRELLLSP
ncbi:hypothetical protein CN168_25840 [Sinorhizobium medicae]|nr:hypothetical protein [Sinorhizobium medicae]RVJ73266.1 hypothetical protein CN168_25840 [Sinorhizobium medicae]